MRCTVFRLALILSGFACVALAHADDKLPNDARIVTGKLDNGVNWIWMPHDNPPGKIAVWVHVNTGSLNETEEQRGLAHFLEHMAFNGTDNFAPGELIPYFESIGMSFGPDVNAHTTFDHTAYKLYLPDATVEQFDKGLMVLSDYVFRMLLKPEEIDKERGVILSELRAGLGADQRLRDEFFKQVFGNTRLGNRLPIGVEDVIANAPPAEFEKYYRTWYRPENITVIVVGDAQPEKYIPSIQKWFGEYHAPLAAQQEHGPELKPFTQERAFVLSDPEHTTGDVSLYNIRASRGPTLTKSEYRANLVDRLGAWIVNRRLDERVRKGDAAYRGAQVGVSDFMQDALLVYASASGEPADWEKMLDQLTEEVNRAREHGFSKREFELARKEFTSSAERAVETDPTRNSRRIVAEINSAVNDQEPVLSAKDELQLVQELLPTITRSEVEKQFAENFAPNSFACVLEMPAKDDGTLPNTDSVLAAARAAEARKTEARAADNEDTPLLASEPKPGKVVESTRDDDLGITSAWLSNGVRVHHRYMDYKKDTVWVAISLAGGQIQETNDNAGVTRIASLILRQPATSRLDSSAIEDLMTGKKVRVGGSGSDDTFTITVSGSPEELEDGLRLAYALLTDGQLEQSAFDNWTKSALRDYEGRSKQPPFVAYDTFFRTIYNNDPRRVILMTPEVIARQSVAAAQAWYAQLCRTAPIEVAVVGDMQLDAVMPLIEKYVGALADRPRHADLEALRHFVRDPGPYERVVDVDTITPQAMIVAGFLGADAHDVHDVRALALAAQALDSQLIKRIREELGLVYGIGANSSPSAAYHNGGFFFSAAPCAPGTGEKVVGEAFKIFDKFAQEGPTDEEFENARKQILNSLGDDLKEPDWWWTRLQTLDLHDVQLADLKNIEQAYRDMTKDDVRATFNKYYRPDATFKIIAHPAAVNAAQPEAAGAAQN